VSHRGTILATLVAASLSAAPGCGMKRAQQECRLEGESVVADIVGSPSAVAAIRLRDGRYAAAWSADGETRFAALDSRGRRAGEPHRADRGPGRETEGDADGGPNPFWPDGAESSFAAEHLALAALSGGGAALGVLERRSESRPGGAFAILLGPELKAAAHVVWLGPAGPFSSRTAAVEGGFGPLFAWHDAAVDGSSVRLAAVSGDGALRGSLVLPAAHPAFSPALAADGDTVLLVWIESRPGGSSPQFDVRVARVVAGPALGPTATVASARYLDPAPTIVSTGGGFGVAFRDDRDSDGTPEYYYAELERSGAVRHRPARISRADGSEGPRLARVGAFVFGVQVRSFGGAFLVGMNRFDGEGRKRGGEFQIYADKSDFTRADVAPGDGKVLLVYGEDRKGAGRILAGAVTCRGM
jgi:hypothetical protein